MDISNLDISVCFSDGYILRNAAHIITSETDVASIVFTPDSITINFAGKNKSSFHDFKFQVEELLDYVYNPDPDHEGNIPEKYVVGFKTQEFNRNVKVSKKDGIVIYITKDARNKISVKHLKSVSRSDSKSASFINVIDAEDIIYQPESPPNKTPYIRILPKEFSEMCTQCSNLKCAFLRIKKINIGDRKGIKAEGVTHDGLIAFQNEFFSSKIVGNRRENNRPATDYSSYSIVAPGAGSVESRAKIVKIESVKFKLGGSTVKALSKINNMSTSKIQIFLTEGQPLVITCEMGNIGTYSLFSSDSED